MRLITYISALSALTTLTHAISLSSNFQSFPPTSPRAPRSCISAYDSTIPSCSSSDFGTNFCSPSCKDALSDLQELLQDECEEISVASGTVLGAALSGKLVDSICLPGEPPEDDDDEDETTTVASTQPPRTTSTSTTESRPTSSSPPNDDDDNDNDDDDEAVATSKSFSSTITETATVTPATTEEADPEETEDEDEGSRIIIPGQGRIGGGGSPFDAQFVGSASRPGHTLYGLIGAVVVVVLGGLL